MTFAEPACFLLLLVLPVLGIGVALAARRRGRQWSAFMASRLRERLLRRAPRLNHWVALTCGALALLFLILALARPRSERGQGTESILGRNIMLVLDLSRSMKVQDLKPDRLTQAKALSYELLEELPDDRIGLIGFAGTPYMFAPLTVDHNAVRQTIAQIDIDWIPTGGSNLEAGLELAIEKLEETGTRQNAMILMSDGEEHEGRIGDLAQRARDAGIEVITIGFGTPHGDIVPDPGFSDGRFRDLNGEEVISRLEPEPLRRLASVTGGRFAVATSGADIPGMVDAAISDLERVSISSRERTVLDEHYQWFVLPAILFLVASVIAMTRWRGLGSAGREHAPATGKAAAAIATLALLLFAGSGRAVTLLDAEQALEEQRFEDAASGFAELAEQHADQEKGFRYRLAEGNAAYRVGDWSTAREAFSDALRSGDPGVRGAAHHALGNTLFEIGWARLSGGPPYPDPGSPEDAAEPDAFDRISDALLDEGEENRVPDNEDPLKEFEDLLKRRLAEWLREPDAEEGESRGSERFHAVVSDWIDAVKHYDSADGSEPSRHNRELTIAHLEKLRDLLSQVREGAEQLQAIPQSGQGSPQRRQGQEGDEPQEGDGQGDEQGDGSSEPGDEDGQGGDNPEDGNGNDDGDEEDGGNEGDQEELEPRPGENAEDAARRILRENADLQKGALSPGRLRFQRPEKDW